MNTNDLIEDLAQELEPAPPLWRPGRRAAAWFVGGGIYIVLLVVAMALVGRDTELVGAPLWWSQIAAIATALLASGAAFASVVPGSPQRLRAWAAVAALVWLATLVAASPAAIDWRSVPVASHEWLCVAVIVIGGAPLMLALTVMLRRGAPMSPATTAALAALAVATLANVAACLSLPHGNGAVTLAWHGGVVLVSVGLAALSGHLVFAWSRPRK